MIVCLCRRVSDKDLRRAMNNGARTLDELTHETGACAHCRCCESCIQEMLDGSSATCEGAAS